MNDWILIILAWGAMAFFMFVLWLMQRIRGNAGIVDVAWSFGTGLVAIGFVVAAGGDINRRILIAGLAGIWALRLGIYLAQRVMREEEDGRYQQLRESWGENTQRNLFFFFQVQALWAVMFAIPMLVAASNSTEGLQWYDFAGAAIWLIAIGGESIADAQLARFRSQADSHGQVCRLGLWRYSRHPNYFFEWVHWWAYVLIGIGVPYWWAGLLFGPALMLFFLFKITGIPPTEKRALQSRGDAYRDYQRTTSVFFPWPPAKENQQAEVS